MRRFALTVLAAVLIVPAAFARHTGFNVNISTDDFEEITRCDQIRITIGDEPAVRAEEQVDGSSLRSLKVVSDRNGGVRVTGWDGPGYSITACKAAANGTALATIHAKLSGNELTATNTDDSYGIVYFLVRAPRGAVLDLYASNGEVSVHHVEGNITATTENGPVSIKASSGTINARAQNGPISFGGASSGTVKLSAQNGPISVKLDGTTFNGSLDASTSNGPLSVKVPRGYRSGVVVESDGHSPFACRAEACDQVRSMKSGDDDNDFFPRRVEFGSGPTVVHLSSHNGPVSVKNSD